MGKRNMMWKHDYAIDEIVAQNFKKIDDVLFYDFMHNPDYIEMTQYLHDYYSSEKRAALAAQLILWRNYVATN